MYIGSCPMQGANTRAHAMRILPTPNADILRLLRRLAHATGLASDASIGARDPRLQHCILLPTAGLLVTATRAHAPLLEANCAHIACIANIDVLLMRFGPQTDPNFANKDASVCLIKHGAAGHVVAREGYELMIPPPGGILLRHALPDVPDWYVGPAGMTLIGRAGLCGGSASTSTGVAL